MALDACRSLSLPFHLHHFLSTTNFLSFWCTFSSKISSKSWNSLNSNLYLSLFLDNVHLTCLGFFMNCRCLKFHSDILHVEFKNREFQNSLITHFSLLFTYLVVHTYSINYLLMSTMYIYNKAINQFHYQLHCFDEKNNTLNFLK